MRLSFLLFDVGNRPTRAFANFLRDVQVPGNDLAGIDDALQSRFFQKNRSGNPLERWELEQVQVSCPQERIRFHLNNCGFISKMYPVTPAGFEIDYVAWPGALAVRAGARLRDIIEIWTIGGRTWKQTIVFGGKRPLMADKETAVIAWKSINPESNRTDWMGDNPQTELDLMMWMWRHADLPEEMRNRSVVFVDAPMKPPVTEGEKPVRPTSEDTIKEWLAGNPKPGRLLLSSGAPYGMAMDEAWWMLLGPAGFTVDTFGHEAPDLPIEIFMREVAGCVNRIRRARGK